MRPNYACDAPPTELTVGGSSYPIDYDYRTWIEVSGLMRSMVTQPETEAHAKHNLLTMFTIEQKVFGGILEEEDPRAALEACAGFLNGYPSQSNGGGGDGPDIVSFEQDLNSIIIAIRNQSGIDLSYRRKEPFHWWEFLLEFQSLCGEHVIVKLMEIRGYKGKDPDMLRARSRYALQHVLTGDEQAALDEVNALDFGE